MKRDMKHEKKGGNAHTWDAFTLALDLLDLKIYPTIVSSLFLQLLDMLSVSSKTTTTFPGVAGACGAPSPKRSTGNPWNAPANFHRVMNLHLVPDGNPLHIKAKKRKPDLHFACREVEVTKEEIKIDEPVGLNLPFLFFLILLILGSQSPVIFYAISVATDVLPLFSDIEGLLTQEAGPAAGILSLVLLLVIVLLIPEFQLSLLAAGDILPFPKNLKETIKAGKAGQRPGELPG
ncbi:MAG TPA: hypothetical protein GXX51_06455 [Firmicutes bacterium]|nr:hypothetical protein [Bacillota bacterium]